MGMSGWPAAARALELNLACNATTFTSHWPSGLPPKFKTHIKVKFDAGTFCIDDECHPFSAVSDKTLEYHCVAHFGGSFCRILGMTTAGPFISNDDIVIDRATWEIRRKSSGFEGDRASHLYASLDEAKCKVVSIVTTSLNDAGSKLNSP
jgi:hypothetical protein